MARRRRRSDLDEPPYDPLPEPPASAPRSGRFLKRCFWLLVFALGLALFAPQIVGRTPLLARLVDWKTTALRGHVTVGGASLSWFSPPQLTNIELVDESGRPVVRVAGIRGDRSLWQMANVPQQLGKFQLDRPEIFLTVGDDGATNLEQVLEKLFAPSTEPSAGVDVAVEIIDGTVHLQDSTNQRQWTIDRVSAVVVVPSQTSAPLTGDVQGSIVTAAGPRRFAVQGSWRNGSVDPLNYLPQGDAAATVEALPLELVELALRRSVRGLAMAGTAQGEVRGRFDLAAPRPAGELSGRLTVADLSVGGPALGGDEVRQSRVDASTRAVIDGDRLQLDELTASCELAKLDARGALVGYRRLGEVRGLQDFVNLLLDCEGQAGATLDLARTAQLLPHVLRVRDDVQITGGSVTFSANAIGAAGTRRRQVELRTAAGLTGVRNGAPITWPEPVQAMASINDAAGGPIVEQIKCTSDFLTIEGTQANNAFELRGQYDLAKLGERLAQFVDLAGIQLRGRGDAQGTWVRESGDRFHVDVQADVNEFELIAPGYPTWTEQRLILGLDAVGRAVGLGLASLEQATIGVQSSGDELTLRLIEPVANAQAAGVAWPVEVSGQGELATWVTRIRPFAGLPPTLVAAGRATLNGTVRYRLPDDFEIVQSRLIATPFRMQGYGLTFDEPNAELQLTGRYRSVETMLNATFTTPQLQAQLQDGIWRIGTDGRNELGGTAAFRADVAKLFALLGSPNPGGAQWSGMLEGSAQLQLADQKTTAAIDATVKNFSVAQPGAAAWQEPAVRIVGTGVYDPQRDALDFERLEVSAEALRLVLAGKLAQLTSVCYLDCRGEVSYDLTRLTPLAQTLLGSGATLTGRETQPFELTGPLFDPSRNGAIAWDKLNGAAKFSWQAANLYGVQLGPAVLDAKLNQGLLRVNPVEVAVNTGRVRLAPSLRLGPGPMELQHDSGVLIDHVSITPEMANERLKYVLPIVAGIAQASGQFSLALDEFRFPLDNPNAATAGGRLTVHAVDIGPGVLTQELATLLQQPLTISLKRESVVDFKLIQGRVYHQNLEFAFPGATIRTYGSVGLDQTISLIAEMPLPTQALANRPVLGQALSAQSIRVPIVGTLQRPQLDRSAFVQAAAQSIQQGAAGAIEAGINRELGRLLGPGAAAPQPGQTTK